MAQNPYIGKILRNFIKECFWVLKMLNIEGYFNVIYNELIIKKKKNEIVFITPESETKWDFCCNNCSW